MNTKIKMLLLALFCYCAPSAAAQASLVSKIVERNPWQFLHKRLTVQAKKRMKSYTERKATGWTATITGALSIAAFGAVFYFVAEDEDYLVDISLFTSLGAFGIASITGIYTFFRGYWLYASAQQEEVIDILDNWSHTKKFIPEELKPLFQSARQLRLKDPVTFDKQLPDFVQELQKEVADRVKQPSFYTHQKTLALLQLLAMQKAEHAHTTASLEATSAA